MPTRLNVRVPADLYRQVQERYKAEGVSISAVVRAALQDHVRYGMETRIRRGPPEEEPEDFF